MTDLAYVLGGLANIGRTKLFLATKNPSNHAGYETCSICTTVLMVGYLIGEIMQRAKASQLPIKKHLY